MKHLAFAVCALLGLNGCVGNLMHSMNKVHEEVTQSVSMSQPGTVTVKNQAGQIRIIVWDKPRVDVDARKSGADQNALRAITVSTTKHGNDVAIETLYGEGTHSGGVDYTIHVPTTSSIDVSNTAGLIEASGLTANVHAESSAGSVRIEMAKLSGNQSVGIDATVGEALLTVPKGANATFRTSTTIGDAKNDAGSTMGNGSAKVTVGTTVGSVKIRVQ
ncbi:MAG TPA: hypothetical protein VGN11_01775 [Candidatus Baltobacteraceae bacterium]|jgi:hypothetical protein|nr:hypothetical protein [Candidatus Baltobacteraceae bacterium]